MFIPNSIGQAFETASVFDIFFLFIAIKFAVCPKPNLKAKAVKFSFANERTMR